MYFGGSGGLEISLPTHITLGPIEIVAATLAVGSSDGVIPIELGATIKGDLGPLKAVVENIGLRATLTFPPNRDGNLGPANLALGFKPPNGVGLSIDAGVVKGGGYLFFDPDKGEYAGALELTIADFLSAQGDRPDHDQACPTARPASRCSSSSPPSSAPASSWATASR